MADEITGAAIKLSLLVGAPVGTDPAPTMVPVNEKLTSDLNINTNEIQVEATFDAGGWSSYLAGQMDGAIPLTMYVRTGSAIYKAIRDRVLSRTPVGFEWDSPNETIAGNVIMLGFSVTQTSTNQVVQVNTNLRLQGEPTVTSK